jgi:hypothetical protein
VSSARRNRLYGDPDSTPNVCSHAEEADGRRTLALHATDGREARTLPRLIAPMLLRPGLPARERAADWAFELKWDGMRAQLRIAPDGRWCLRSRPGRDCSDRFPELAALADALRGGAVLLDGELVCLNSDGRPDFQRLRRRLSATDHAAAAHLADAHPSTLVVVDVLNLDGRAVRDLPTRSAASSSAHELPAAGPSRPNPLMTRAQCSAWLAQRGYPEPSKSACIGCPIPHHVVLAFLWRRSPCHPIDCRMLDERPPRRPPSPASASAPHRTREWVHTRSVLDSRTVSRSRRSPTRRVALDDDRSPPMGMHAGRPARARVTVLTRRVTAVIEGSTLGRVQIARLLKALTR